jgi:putative aldouronate transport system permease protein
MNAPVRKQNPLARFCKELSKNRTLYAMILPALAFVAIFNYAPLYGIQVAFKNYNFVDGITKSPFIGLKNFEFYFKSMFFLQTTRNTLFLNFLFIVFGVSFQVLTAVLLNEVGRKRQKVFQTLMFFPYFISWVVVSQFVTAMLSQKYGIFNIFLIRIGKEPVAWFNEAKYWPVILTIASVWKGLGYGSVIYLAKIAGIDSEIYEAAIIDGANKAQEITRITLPLLVPTVVLLLLIAIGGIFRGDFQMIYSIVGDTNTGQLLPVTDVIDTYVYRAMKLNSQFGMASAVGLYQSIVGFCLVMLSNYLVRRYDPEIALF